ncbi:MAG: DUF4446 family protein [Solirubrobacteraceae bacterium]
MHGLSSTTGIVALAAGAVAIVALLSCIWLALRLRRLRAQQSAVLGDRRRDLVAHAASLQGQFEALHGYVEDVAAGLEARMGTAEVRLDGAIAHSSVVRYDAYREMSGRQSISLALLDARRSGVVLSAIYHRDQARLYAKQVRQGQGTLELSPEEDEAVRAAIEGPADGDGDGDAAALGR